MTITFKMMIQKIQLKVHFQKYQNLYQICWNEETKSRHDIKEVYEIISQIVILKISLIYNLHTILITEVTKVVHDLTISSNSSSKFNIQY